MREVLETAGQQQEPARKIMATLLGIGAGQEFNASILSSLTPGAVLRLDMIADQMLELGRKDDAVRTLRAAVIHGVK